MLIVLGKAQTTAAHRTALFAAAQRVTEATRTDAGCISYGFYSDITDSGVVVSVEVWRDQAALDAHMDHPHTADFLRGIDGLRNGAPEMSIHHTPDTDA